MGVGPPLWMERVGRLASQTAAHKLVHIMGLLVIPSIVLLTLYFIKSKTEIDAIVQERAGVKLAHWVVGTPAALSTAQLQKRRELERAAGVLAEPVRQTVAAELPQEELDTYLPRVGDSSRVVLDSEQSVQALAAVAFALVPSYTQKLKQLSEMALPASAAGQPSLMQSQTFLLAAGDIQSVLRRIEDELISSEQLQTADISRSLKPFNEADTALSKVTTAFANSNLNAAEKQLHLNTFLASAQALTSGGSKALQGHVLAAIDQQLGDRISKLWVNLALLMCAGITSAMASIGLAMLMIRSTVLRLEEVERARQDAQLEKTEAETVVARFTGINADISRLNQDLAQKVSELKLAQEELIKKGRMEQLGQLIATIAHEVRNPLGAIRTTAFMLERKIADKNLGLEGHIQRINNSVHRCDTIISQLLDFSRTKEVNSTPMLLDEWVAKVVREEAARLPENILIECALGLDRDIVAIDPVRLQRALVNLLNNASEALLSQHDRGLSGTQLHHHIWVSTKRVGDFAIIRIADNGPGIAAEYIQKIREPLFTTKSFGTGLGIPAVEQVVNQHGGRLDISSDIGKGAVFSIYLPLPRQNLDAA
jgi:signal transduction histidine kinase